MSYIPQVNLPGPEEVPFELLHLELVNEVLNKSDSEQDTALSNLELIG